MKKLTFFLSLLFVCNLAFGQKNFIDQPYVETTAQVDTLVVPDRIHIAILLNEADSKKKKTVEELEKILETTLKGLNINTEEDLSLVDLSSNLKNYFLKGQSIIKSKIYSLIVYDAVTAGKVLAELESVGISNVSIAQTEYSQPDAIILELKEKAIQKSQVSAETLAKALGQKIGKAIYISDENNVFTGSPGNAPTIRIRGFGSYSNSSSTDPISTEFQKVKFEVEVRVKYILE